MFSYACYVGEPDALYHELLDYYLVHERRFTPMQWHRMVSKALKVVFRRLRTQWRTPTGRTALDPLYNDIFAQPLLAVLCERYGFERTRSTDAVRPATPALGMYVEAFTGIGYAYLEPRSKFVRRHGRLVYLTAKKVAYPAIGQTEDPSFGRYTSIPYPQWIELPAVTTQAVVESVMEESLEFTPQ